MLKNVQFEMNFKISESFGELAFRNSFRIGMKKLRAFSLAKVDWFGLGWKRSADWLKSASRKHLAASFRATDWPSDRVSTGHR